MDALATPIKIKSIRKFKQVTKVHDITVKDNENFFANGILVHNCPFACQYCYADAFKHSLYTSFFDNSKSMGLRHTNPDFFKKGLDVLMEDRGKDPHNVNGELRRAVAMDIPMRFGIRFEDFIHQEEKVGVSLELLRHLGDMDYPVMINTKSHIVGKDKYVQALADNKAGAAVHMTALTPNAQFNKLIEPGAPTWEKRVQACKNLVDAGVRVVARIEPYMIYMTDEPDDVERYIEEMQDAGVKHITFDTYSYSANNPGIRQSFVKRGYDFERMFLLGCDSQGLGSLLLDSFMQLFRSRGFSCSTFDLGCMANNNQTICCEVGDWFKAGYNYGSIVPAARLIIQRGNSPTRWSDFEAYVNERGGFLSDRLQQEVKELWNLEGNVAFFVNWAAGVEPAGRDEDGMVWKKSKKDFRQDLLAGILKEF